MSPFHRYLAGLVCFILSSVSGAERERWTSSNVQGSPEPPSPFLVERAFPNITFKNPLDAATIPGTERMVVVEQYGKLWSISKDEKASSPDLFLDLRDFDPEARESYGMTFHPKFKENHFAYVIMILDGKGKPNREDGTRIVRFKMTETNPPRLDPKSGTVVFSWLSGGHNGGGIRFGPDGMLYLSTGDAEVPDPPDPRMTGQDISDLLASVLRIDVDHPSAGKNYGVPKDNPFVSTPGARPEIWAYGFRNPFRLSFDAKKGDLWVGDVGWELWEMIHKVERGGNYGWSIIEAGIQEVHPNAPRGPTPILKPTMVHPHDEAASITGGEVYYGKKLPELNGAYIYADWQFGTFWSLRVEGSKVTEHRELCRSSLMPAGFGAAPDGDLIICDHGGGGLWRLARNPEAGKNSKFPRRLSETGLFADTAGQKAATGVVEYDVQAHRWADHATSRRWIAIPNGEKITLASREWGMLGRGRWVFPTNTVFALTYSLGDKKVETQLTHFNGTEWGAYSYKWNAAGTDADLVGPKGEEVALDFNGAKQSWKYFARSECLRCHTVWNNFTPGFNGPQLEAAFLKSYDLKDTDVSLTDPHGNGALELRARSYLHANCSVCHRQAGGGAARSWMNIEEPLRTARLVDQKPVAGDLGLPDARVILAGAPERSVLLYRMTTGGRGHMPYLGGRTIDEKGVLLVRDWIQSMQPERSAKGVTTGDIDRLLESPDGALQVALAVIDGALKDGDRMRAIEKGSALADPLKRDLFEHFLPPDQRRKVLGANFPVEKVLTTKGDAERGKALFTAICTSCHHIGVMGTDFGPDLVKVGAKYDRTKLLEQVQQPGKIIEPDWFLTTVKLKDGEPASGFLTGNVLKMAGGLKRELSADEAKTATKARASIMPEGLLDSLTAQEAADLIDFLAAQK